MKYLETFLNGFVGYFYYLLDEITHPSWHNYFYGLLSISLFFFGLEVLIPWRKKQAIIRKGFWQDAFYMFFNFFLFSLIGYNAIANVLVEAFKDLLGAWGVSNLVAIQIASWSIMAQLLTLFVVRDFVQWNVHRLLHRVPWLWEVHKLHHSVTQMGFAAHLRYHFMETIVYRFFEYLPLAMIGFGIQDFYMVHIFTLAIGHFNHSNIRIPLGPLKYIFNNPQMHLWHHAKYIPNQMGINFGITLSIWDYLFGTAYTPNEEADIPLGFEQVEMFPEGFVDQQLFPFKTAQKTNE